MSEPMHNERAERKLKHLAGAIESGRLEPIRKMLAALNAGEIAHLLESLPLAKRLLVWEVVDDEQDGDILVHVNEEVRATLINEMEDDELVAAAGELELDDLADILDDLPEDVISEVLLSMDHTDRERLAHVLSYSEDSAGGLMNPDAITVRADVTLDVVKRYLRIREDLPEPLDQIFVVDREAHYMGRLPLHCLLLEDGDKEVFEFIDNSFPAFRVETPATDVAHDFETYDMISAPVVDNHNILAGFITIDDIVDVIREEGEHSVLSMAGLDEDEDMFAPVLISVRRRSLWLGINLLTAFLAAAFIGLYEDTLKQIVALAVLMPIVASMGGIAGTQTLTLVIRALAVGQIAPGNIRDVFNKELLVGVFSGIILSLIVAGITSVWFHDINLGYVIAMALVINIVTGALSGVFVPIILKRMQIDPALAGGVVLTTVTDITGFVSFLGLGTWLLL
ncbi:MAG: magnesium transporter [bacterium]